MSDQDPPRRHHDCATLNDLLSEVRTGQSAVLVPPDEAGVNKTVLLRNLSGAAFGPTIARCAGVDSAMELPLAGCTN